MNIPVNIKMFRNCIEEGISIQLSNKNDTVLHGHNFIEIAYVVNGSAIHYFNGAETIIRKGDFFAIDYNQIHKYSPDGTSYFEVINCLFSPEFVDVSLSNTKSFSDLVSNYLIKFNYTKLKTIPTHIIFQDETGEVHDLLKKMLKEYSNKNNNYKELLRCYLIELIIITLRKICLQNTVNAKHDVVDIIQSEINKSYMNHVSLTEICDRLGYSVPYISALFSKFSGISFNAYLQKVRVEKSCHFLANTDHSIDEIVCFVGYSDIKYFRNIFKKQLGMSPSNFRKLYRYK